MDTLTDAAPEATGRSAPPMQTRRPKKVSRWRSLKIIGIGAALWAAPLLVIVAWRGPDSLHARLYGFFTRAAFVTFGGAYAVLAYVTQAAAGAYGWISQLEAIDGLALAETTPGPLIMVLQFIGFMAGWHHPEGLTPLASATIAALLTTFATFLPSFLFIFLGAPYVEKLRGNRSLSAALSSITAAVVGVIAQLAVVFAVAVLWPRGFANGFNAFALGLAVAAFLALRRFRLDVLWVIAAGAAAGLLWTLVAR